MEWINILVISLILSENIALTGKGLAVRFNITIFKACLSSDIVLNKLIQVSLQQCVDECSSRVGCRAVNYFRHFHLCELLPVDDGNLYQSGGKNRACVLVKKADMDLHEIQTTCTCAARESCDIESHAICTHEECKPVNLENGKVSGNMLSLGSTVTFECDQMYIEVNGKSEATCLANGTWSYYPQCKRDCNEPTRQISNATLSNGKTYEGQSRTFKCNPGFIFPVGYNAMNITCRSDGQWSTMLCPTETNENNTCNGCILPRDCQDRQGLNDSSPTTLCDIYPVDSIGFEARCDMDTPPGGWTVIQRRVNDSDFKRNWEEYKEGFGNLNGNFWLGNDKIWKLTNGGHYKLRVDLVDQNGDKGYAEYSSFSIGDESSKYTLNISGHSGTANDSLITRHNGMKFSTFDQDNDNYETKCAVEFGGGWWYSDCQSSNLNGPYGSQADNQGMTWKDWRNSSVSMLFTEMKIRRE
ncbi:tenascin-N-like [Mercenaria mercenaria]|uniref:tenascin-N-like n=1 Tax=Mercenaria mercenaria TaxID=6596 RepID=UPI001E1E050C|nr:tenascin-N-like [Mercenaria mercenaria]